MIKKWWALFLLPIVFTLPAVAQQTWFEVDVSKKLGDKLEFILAPELRLNESFRVDEYFIEPGVEYSFCDYFTLGAAYRVGNDISKNGNDQWFGRYSFEAKTAYDWKRFGAQFRVRFTDSDDFADEENSQYLRFRFKLEYNIKGMPLNPYFAYELYRDVQIGKYDRARWEAGLEYKLSKLHYVGAYYRLNEYLIDDESNLNIIGLTYKLKL